MSMTGPMTWTTLPVRVAVAVCAIFNRSGGSEEQDPPYTFL
jgi:hypothetical protein